MIKILINIKNLFFDRDRWEEIWMTITRNKSRSILTAFGVFWGMFMLVAMLGAGSALKTGIFSQIEDIATKSCFVFNNRTSLPYQGFRKGRRWNLVNADIPVIKQNIPEIEYLAPIIIKSRSDNNVTHGEHTGSFPMTGHYPVYNKVKEHKMLQGRFINDIDITENRKVCIIGERVYEVLFPTNENPVGKYIQVSGIYFQVMGVFHTSNNLNFNGNTKEEIIMPFTAMQQAFNMGNAVDLLAIMAKPEVTVTEVENKAVAQIKALHFISPDDTQAVMSFNIEDELMMFVYLALGIGALIWFVGGGTLLAGGIGISNIMLITIRERTKEIGIRRALGATPGTIIGQIISESLILTFIAGMLGLMFGVGVLRIADIILSQSDGFFKGPQINFGTAMLSFVVLVIIGLLAGYMPARRAMKIKAIDAIREE